MPYMDTRDLVERREEIEDEVREEENPDLEQLKAIEDLAEEIGGEFEHGETMIPVSEFEDYAQELARDIGAISGEEGWPLRHIDWEAAARELKADYVEVSWEGTNFLVRSV